MEIEKSENLQKISLLEASVITEKSNCESLTQEKMSLNSRVQQLEEEIKVLNDKSIDSDRERLESEIAHKDNEIKKLEVEKNQNRQSIEQLKIEFHEKESQLKTAIEDSNNRIQELEDEIDFLKHLSDKVVYSNGSNGLIEELRKQIAQKDAVIKKLESENYENIESLKILAESFEELTENFNNQRYQLELVTRHKIDLDNRVKDLEAEKSLLIHNLRDRESKISELEEIINKKDAMIHELTIIDSEERYPISPIEELEQYLEELEQDLEDLEKYAEKLEKYTEELGKYADDMEKYAEELEQYYLEKLETYSDISNITEVEDLKQQITEKDACIINLKSHISLLLENESLKDLGFLRLFYGELIEKCQCNKLRRRKLLKLRKPYASRLINLSLLLIPSTVPLVVLPSK